MRRSILLFVVLWHVACAKSISKDKSVSKEEDKRVFLLKEFKDDSNRKVMVITWNDDKDDVEDDERNDYTCEVFTETRLIEKILKHSRNPTIWRPNTDEMRSILEKCVAMSINWRPRQEVEDEDSDEVVDDDLVEQFSETAGLNISFPGTKWCGPGNTASNYCDLGYYRDTDKCCREHDHCDDTLEPGETIGNLTNESSTSQLNCKCDETLYDCLNEVDDIAANTIGYQYFTIAGRSCYRYDYPSTGECKKWKSFLHLRCLEYYKDKTSPKEWQWSTTKNYKKPSILMAPIRLPLDAK